MPSQSHINTHIRWVALMDVLCLLTGSVIGVMARFAPEEMGEYVFDHIDGWIVLWGSVILANYLAGSYRLQSTYSRFNLVVTWIFSMLFALLILSITSYAWFRLLLGRGVLAISLGSYGLLALFLKLLVYRALFRSQIFLCRTVVLGCGKTAQQLREVLESDFVLPRHKVVACVRMDGDMDCSSDGTPVVKGVAMLDGTPGSLEDIVRSLDVNLIVLALDDHEFSRKLYPLLRRLRFDGIEVLMPLNVVELYAGRMPLDMITEEFMMDATLQSGLPVVRQAKRLVDILVSLVILIIMSPVMLVTAILIKLSEPKSPVFYMQKRVGHFGRRFMIFKFRTMREGAEDGTGAVWAASDDERITAPGRVLRKFRIDEFPQLFNVLGGDMSLVGPRPERPEIVEKLSKEIPFYDERENVMPGLTGWAQTKFPYGSSIEDARRKLEFDLYYIKHLCMSLDLQIILSTIRIVLFGMERKKTALSESDGEKD